MVPLESNQLRLRALQTSDAHGVFGILGHEPTTALVSWRQPSLEMATAWLRRRCDDEAKHGYSMWAAELQGETTIVGLCGFFATRDATKLELGYVIHADSWGRGWATEIAQVAANAALWRNYSVVASIRPANHASIRVAEKIGMTRSGSVRDTRGDLELFELNPVEESST